MNEEQISVYRQMAINILRHVQRDYPDAFIAWGFLRDLDCGRQPKDLDIFTFKEPFVGAELRANLGVDEDYKGDARINCVSRYSEFALPVDVVHLASMPEQSPDKVVSEFSLGLQQIYMVVDFPTPDMRYIVFPAPAYTHDKRMRVLTVRHCTNGYEAMRIHFKLEALKAKFDWPVIVPPEFSQWEDIIRNGFHAEELKDV